MGSIKNFIDWVKGGEAEDEYEEDDYDGEDAE